MFEIYRHNDPIIISTYSNMADPFAIDTNIVNEYKKSQGRKYSFLLHGKKKRSRYKYLVKDGWITLVIDLKPTFNCQCDEKTTGLCTHLLSLFVHELKLSFRVISMLVHDEVYTRLLDLIEDSAIKKENYSRLLIKTIYDFFGDDICGICNVELVDKEYKMKLHKCCECKKYNHSQCVRKWYYNRNTENNKLCIYCKKELFF